MGRIRYEYDHLVTWMSYYFWYTSDNIPHSQSYCNLLKEERSYHRINATISERLIEDNESDKI